MGSFLLLFPLAGCFGGAEGGTVQPTSSPGDFGVRLVEVARGLEQPVDVGNAGDGSDRLFVVEQEGRIRIVTNGTVAAQPFLDIVALVRSGGEQGLFSVAFHPDYEENGRFFIHYTDVNGDTVVSEYRVSALDGDRADVASARILLQVDQPYSNHNGGEIAFGPDGYLYIGLGDGGGAGDPHENGQDLGTLLGKLLRIDVDGAPPYGTPAGNPFSGPGQRREIWAYGLRNPWKFSFDRDTGDLYVGDVGQNSWEEVDFQAASSRGGENYGWNRYEGSHRFRAGSAPDYVPPVAEYSLAGANCAVTGGHVYRGEREPKLEGIYFFGDYCSGTLWSMHHGDGGWRASQLLDTDYQITSFGEDEAGEVYVADHGGKILRLVSPM